MCDVELNNRFNPTDVNEFFCKDNFVSLVIHNERYHRSVNIITKESRAIVQMIIHSFLHNLNIPKVSI